MDVEEQYNKIYRYCYMKTRYHYISDDLTQETFLRFLENHSYGNIGKQKTSILWAITVIVVLITILY